MSKDTNWKRDLLVSAVVLTVCLLALTFLLGVRTERFRVARATTATTATTLNSANLSTGNEHEAKADPATAFAYEYRIQLGGDVQRQLDLRFDDN